jgi:alpha-L-fucosidase 2
MKTHTLGLIALFTMYFCSTLYPQSATTLWYTEPAQYFEESLVLGNGKMGASVFGGVTSDKIYLNDATLWSGGPVDARMNPEAYTALPLVRDALKNENYRLADSLNRKLQGKFSESYAPLGTLTIDFQHSGDAQHYYRELNIGDAVSTVRYEVNDVRFTREYFVSHPDHIMAIRLTSSRKGALSFSLKFQSLLKYHIVTSHSTLTARGYAPIHAEPDYRGNIPNAVVFDERKGTRFTALAKIIHTDGTIATSDSSVGVTGGSEALIEISIGTSFNGFDKDPVAQGVDDEKIAAEHLAKASRQSFQKLKSTHLADYHPFFNRVSLNLGKTDAPDLPTNERLKRYADGYEDKNLEILYFQYGRYLLISSSRTPGVPANLQGIWNSKLQPPWSCNYTTNINAEENYWPAENTNLSELHLPLLGFIKNLSVSGAITAQTFYGVQHGWVACHNSDIWAMTNPVGNFGEGDPIWANWNMGAAWLSTHLWEHYIFTQDKEFLKSEAYPLMKGAAQFCLEWMVEDKDGLLITSPSTSPENKYVTPDGYHGGTLYGGTADLALIRECLQQSREASLVLKTDGGFRDSLAHALARMRRYQIGKAGNLQEWYFDWMDEDPHHRHQSHLFGLFPGHQITPNGTPELADACRKSLEIKGDETTGWSKGWRINLWARLWDGNHAYKMYRELLRYVDPDGMRKNSSGGGTYPNLLDAHPPFQIDGNFGGTAAVVEMLMQSDINEIRLLPALPDAWADGSVRGICARGGFEISMDWKNKTLIKIGVHSKTGGATTLICGAKQKAITLKKGESVSIAW